MPDETGPELVDVTLRTMLDNIPVAHWEPRAHPTENSDLIYVQLPIDVGPQFHGDQGWISISGSEDVRLWAFATATHNESQGIQLISPQVPTATSGSTDTTGWE